MKMAIVVTLACLLVTNMAPCMGSEDWLSGGYVVTHHYPAYAIGSWGHGISYPLNYGGFLFTPFSVLFFQEFPSFGSMTFECLIFSDFSLHFRQHPLGQIILAFFNVHN
jgi:hypothetical protein